MRALVISGGGSKGAFAGGVAEHLIRKQGKKYDLFLGSPISELSEDMVEVRLTNSLF